jgi:hypothetical protein
VLREAIALGESGVEATDEAALAETRRHVVHIVEATAKNLKITTADDLAEARRRLSNEPIRIMAERVGTGYDLHRLVEGRPLLLGGMEIPAARRARSFGCRRRLPRGDRRDPRRGSLGDIGRHFPDTDPRWKDASSLDLLRQAVAMVHTPVSGGQSRRRRDSRAAEDCRRTWRDRARAGGRAGIPSSVSA